MNMGVRQGCLLSPMIFIMVVDWIMREVESHGKTGIQWTLATQLHDLDFADDICLLSQNLQHMQIKTEHLALKLQGKPASGSAKKRPKL